MKMIKTFNKKETIIFNFDTIAKSTYFFPDKNTSNQVNTIFKMFVKNNKDLTIKSSPIKLPFGSHTDGYYLKKKGFQGIGIGDMDPSILSLNYRGVRETSTLLIFEFSLPFPGAPLII